MKNVIFDFGQVLVRFDPEYMTAKYVSDADDVRRVSEVLFDRLYWDRLDDGSISDEEVIADAKKRLPERLWDSAEKVYYNWIYQIPEIEGMRALAEGLRQDFGVRLYLLSNIGVYFAEHAGEIPLLSAFDRCFFSAVLGTVKPSAEIFALLCKKTGAKPEETIFIDDNEKNIRGARAFGIEGYLFDGNVAALRTYLYGLLTKE